MWLYFFLSTLTQGRKKKQKKTHRKRRAHSDFRKTCIQWSFFFHSFVLQMKKNKRTARISIKIAVCSIRPSFLVIQFRSVLFYEIQIVRQITGSSGNSNEYKENEREKCVCVHKKRPTTNCLLFD